MNDAAKTTNTDAPGFHFPDAVASKNIAPATMSRRVPFSQSPRKYSGRKISVSTTASPSTHRGSAGSNRGNIRKYARYTSHTYGTQPTSGSAGRNGYLRTCSAAMPSGEGFSVIPPPRDPREAP